MTAKIYVSDAEEAERDWHHAFADLRRELPVGVSAESYTLAVLAEGEEADGG